VPGVDRVADLHIAEILFENGAIRFRYSRKLAPDGEKWIREGLFQAFHPNRTLASEGTYSDGVEDGRWRDFHENVQLAAEGIYSHGVEIGIWRFWTPDGAEEPGRG